MQQMFSSKCETFASQVAYMSNKLENFLIWTGNCDITSTKIWRH